MTPSLARLAARSAALVAVGSLTATVACRNDIPQESSKADPGSVTTTTSTATPPSSSAGTGSAASSTTTTTTNAMAAAPADPGAGAGGGSSGADPLKGKFALADATKGITGSGDLVATIDTSKGKMMCKMYDDKAPTTVANFVGLARGTRPWKDPKTSTWVTRPAYNGTTFHRVIKGFMIQGGDPLGNGTGEPGYVIPDEIWSGAKHDRAGLLCMANRGANTNGAQFFITDDAAPFLDGKYTIFGECKPLDVEHAIATVDVAGPQHSSPTTPVLINSVTVARAKY